MGKYRITVDTGGTFTDVVYYNDANSELTIHKLPSTPHDPSEAILGGVTWLLDKGVKADEIEFFCHGTTVGTNALLEGKGATAGLLITAGYNAIYELRGGTRPTGSDLIDTFYMKPAALIPLERTAEIRGVSRSTARSSSP